MEFEELQVIWDQQKERTMYAIDEEALQKHVERYGRDLGRMVETFEVSMIFFAICTAILTVRDPVLRGIDYHELSWGVMFVMVAVYLAVGRVRRRRRDAGFEPTLLGDVRKAIARVDYQIERHRSFVWWFIAPAVVGSAISYAVNGANKPMWVWGLLALSFPVAWGVVRLSSLPLFPKKRELEALRDKLTTAE